MRLKEECQQEYETWKRRPLRGRYVYLFADGLYLKAGGERQKTAVLVVLGVDEQGHKELLAMEEGYRESTTAWAETLRSLKERGLQEPPLLAIGDGALGLWGSGRGLSHHPPSAVLESPVLKRSRQTPQAPTCRGPQAAARISRGAQSPGVRAAS